MQMSWLFPSGFPMASVTPIGASFCYSAHDVLVVRYQFIQNQYQKMEAFPFGGWRNVGKGDVIYSYGFKFLVFMSAAQTFLWSLSSYIQMPTSTTNLTSLKLNSLFVPLHVNQLLLLPQPPTPDLFFLKLPKSVASLALLLEPEVMWSSLTQSFPSLATCSPPASHLLALKHIFNESFSSSASTITFLIHHHHISPKLLQLLQVSYGVFLLLSLPHSNLFSSKYPKKQKHAYPIV